MAKKRIIGLLFGGRSAEHEVSVQSARNVLAALDPEKYQVVPIGITKQGEWLLGESPAETLADASKKALPDNNKNIDAVSVPNLSGAEHRIEVLFPVLHGPYGEDGTVQGLAKLLNLPCVGAGVAGSAIGMDKDVMKRLLQQAKIPIVKHVVLRRSDQTQPSFADLTTQLGKILFVKPANMGSSVGISKVTSAQELEQALTTAFKYDTKIIIEQGMTVREIEISVLGNEQPEVSVPGELVVSADFYSYDAKYSDDSQTEAVIPAQISQEIAQKIDQLAKEAFLVLECRGMARIDFFLTSQGEVYLNEINTLPGFTNISMYPKLWEASGVSQSVLVDRLVELAIEAAEEEVSLSVKK